MLRQPFVNFTFSRIPLRSGRSEVMSPVIDEIRDRQGIRLLIRTRTEFLPTTAQADQKSSMGAAWPDQKRVEHPL